MDLIAKVKNDFLNLPCLARLCHLFVNHQEFMWNTKDSSFYLAIAEILQYVQNFYFGKEMTPFKSIVVKLACLIFVQLFTRFLEFFLNEVSIFFFLDSPLETFVDVNHVSVFLMSYPVCILADAYRLAIICEFVRSF